LTDKDDGNISSKVMDWLTNIVTVVTIIVGLLSVVNVKEEEANKTAWTIFIFALMIVGTYQIYRYRRYQKLKIVEELVPITPTATLRGLLPFEDGDQLLGRRHNIQDLYTLIASKTFRFGVLLGESGCGKTSLLRAGLLPKLRDGNFFPLYIHKPTNDPLVAIRSVLLKEIPELESKNIDRLDDLLHSIAPKGKKIIILIDQFEEFFLTNRTAKSRASFAKWLGETTQGENLPVSVLISIRSDFFSNLLKFSPYIEEPTSSHSSHELQNFDSEQAKQILSMAAKADGISFEPELIQTVISELEAENRVRPAELQIVGTRLKRKNIVSLNKYEILGGAHGILGSYINEEIKQSANERVARLILRLMCADTGEAKSPIDLSLNDIIDRVRGISASDFGRESTNAVEIQKIIAQFVSARMLIRTEDNKYNLAHDYLAPYLRSATEGAETNIERASRLLKRYAAEYREDPKTLIPFRHIKLISKYASPDLKSNPKVQEVLKKSRRVYYFSVTIPVIVIMALYLFLESSYYYTIENSFLVIKNGHPQLKWIPGFDQTVIQTETRGNAINSEYAELLSKEEITGFWLVRSKNNYYSWGDQLILFTSQERSAQAMRLLDQSLVFNLISSDDPSVLTQSAASFDTFFQINPQAVQPELVLKLILLINHNDYSVRENALKALKSMIHANPQSITPEIIQRLTESIDNNPDAIAAFTFIVQNSPPRISPDIVQKVAVYLTDENYYYRYHAVNFIGAIAQTNPDLITLQMVQNLTNLLDGDDNNVINNVSKEAATALGLIAQTKPQIITPRVVEKLVKIIGSYQVSDALITIAKTNPQSITPKSIQNLIDDLSDYDEYVRYYAEYTLVDIAQGSPQIITESHFQTLINLLDNDSDYIRYPAMHILGALAQFGPKKFSFEVVQSLVNLLDDSNSYRSSEALSILGNIAQVRPETFTSDIVHKLIDHITYEDPQSSFTNREVAKGLGSIAQANPESITPEIFQRLVDLAERNNPSAGLALCLIAQARPEIISPQMIDLLMRLLYSGDYDVSIEAAKALTAIKSPNSGSEIIQMLTSQLDTADCSYAARPFGNIYEANPQLISFETTQKIFEKFYNDGDCYHAALEPLKPIANYSPQNITSDNLMVLLAGLNNLDIDDYSDGPALAYILGRVAHAHESSISTDVIRTLFQSLKSDNSVAQRAVASCALFEIAFNNSNQAEIIKPQLENLRLSPEPHWRIAAAKALEMIAIGELVDEARLNPEKNEQIKTRLTYLTDIDLQEGHLRYAAAKALAELDNSKLDLVRLNSVFSC
jgi:HEAT repeat protein